MRVVLEPLIPRPPMVAAISGSFLELPAFDFNLTGAEKKTHQQPIFSLFENNFRHGSICAAPAARRRNS